MRAELSLSRQLVGSRLLATERKLRPTVMTALMNRRDFDAAGIETPRSEFRPVVDRTGLEGIFEITLTWEHAGEPAVDVEDQLGLKLEPGKARVDFLVIDRAEPLTAN